MSLTIKQQTNQDGFPKAGELIELIGAHELEAHDRAIANLLYQHIHDSGLLLTENNPEFTYPLNALRFSKDEVNNLGVIASIQRIMDVKVKVSYIQDGENVVLETHLLAFIKYPNPEYKSRKEPMLRFMFPDELRRVVMNSEQWGRIRAEIVCAMTSKYAIQLYELIAKRINMDQCVEVFTIERFRDIMNVPPGSYDKGSDFFVRVVEPALLEVNGLSDFGVDIDLRRKHSRAPVHEVAVTWWKKEGDEFRHAQAELNNTKLGRMARLRETAKILPKRRQPSDE